MDPSDIGKILKAAKSLESLVGGETAPLKFGVAKGSREDDCARVHVFMRLVGAGPIANDELRRDVAPPSTTPEQMLARFRVLRGSGEAMDQTIIRDENGFILSSALRGAPLTDLSSGCRLNLLFTHEKRLSEHAAGVPERFVRDGTSWIRSKLRSAGDGATDGPRDTPPAPRDRRDRDD